MNSIEEKIREGVYSVGLNGVAVVDNTFWFDFSVADMYGMSAIKDTYKRSFNAFKKDIDYITALAITLNHKGWQHYEQKDEKVSQLYFKLYEELDKFVLDGEWSDEKDDMEYKNFKSEEITYYVHALD